MCLSLITNTYLKNDRQIKGYKVVRRQDNAIFPACMRKKRLKSCMWLDEYEWRIHNNRILADSGVWYNLGWHIFANLKDARTWRNIGDMCDEIHECIGRNVRVVGTQQIKSDKERGAKVCVCAQLKIGKRVK